MYNVEEGFTRFHQGLEPARYFARDLEGATSIFSLVRLAQQKVLPNRVFGMISPGVLAGAVLFWSVEQVCVSSG